MKYLLILVFAGFTSFFSCAQKDNSQETTTYYFIRHAEKDRTDATNKNPHLTQIGIARAEKWRNILQHIPFDKIYSTDYNRTLETAQPTATKNGLEIIIYNDKETDINPFLNDTKGETVLIVGHSDTTPQFVNRILDSKKYKDIDDSNNGNLYIITIINGKKLDQVLTIN
ncbi:phosphoglycerate mutase family protein [Xanthomarina sp. F2636L]|uniref:phosphoglycerate mutase family protein n=1 Tax=Xanthomarina sp. F2636L TaxID=2996018 RepID=UPI00225E2D9A|nr:phosphoglycerate mutase family protein [Xanthomarina sp. F2636L]MCX7552167.1 phosphoglycerate mutase family protein [Xanthomarina sp. F2636L]